MNTQSHYMYLHTLISRYKPDKSVLVQFCHHINGPARDQVYEGLAKRKEIFEGLVLIGRVSLAH